LKKQNIIFSTQKDIINNNFKLTDHSELCKTEKHVNYTCKTINKVDNIKYLGLHIDNNLKCRKLIDYVISTARKFFFIFRNIRNILDKKYLRIIYISFVQPVIYIIYTFGIEIWGGTFNTHLIKLKTTLNIIIKCILK